MAKEKFILVSLKDDESKKLAQIITNDTSRKILDYLAEKDATESDIASKLGIPISTVHYNLQALVKGRLVEADEYHYSEKGKEVLHYKLANKYIIIAPKSTFGIKEKLRSILPVSLLALAGSAIFYTISWFRKGVSQAAVLSAEIAPKAMRIEAANDAVEEAAYTIAKDTGSQVYMQPNIWQNFLQNPASWFLFGCIFTLILLIVVEYINYKKKK